MRRDILLDQQSDLKLHNGDFDFGKSDQQHIEHILTAQKGEYKETPLLGFGIINYLKLSKYIQSDFKRDLKIQLEYDGYQNSTIDLSAGFENLKIEV
ncbi:MAG: oxidase [Bergeyella cardium]|nr:MAG TPA: hypothetical protein [Caudoviricetes sp.]